MRHSDTPDPKTGDIMPGGASQRAFVEQLHGLRTVIWEMDARTWQFTFVGDRAQQIFGYPIDRWAEEGFWQDVLVHGTDRDWCVGFCSTASAECRNHAFMYRARTADGEIRWIQDVVRVIPDENGEPALLRGIMVDVTGEVSAADMESGHLELNYDDPRFAAFRKVLAA